jgi:hypothetical protein
MTTYRVIWEIDIDADSPREAAEHALAIQRNPESFATVFDVVDGSGDRVTFDLSEHDPLDYEPFDKEEACCHDWATDEESGRSYCLNCGADGDA